jgi:hypothetical protein
MEIISQTMKTVHLGHARSVFEDIGFGTPRIGFGKSCAFSRFMIRLSGACLSPKFHPDEGWAGLVKFRASFVKDSQLRWGVR